jgi:hypothetical protein
MGREINEKYAGTIEEAVLKNDTDVKDERQVDIDQEETSAE